MRMGGPAAVDITPRKHRLARWAATVIAAAAASGLLIPAGPAAALSTAGAVPVLNWQACADPAAAGFECATAQVPLDYTSPAGPTIELAVIRHLATGPGPRIGSLFFNPGGPGGSGVASLPAVYSFFPAALRQRFDIVSFDPRGVGQSTAVPAPGVEYSARSTPADYPAGPGVSPRTTSQAACPASIESDHHSSARGRHRCRTHPLPAPRASAPRASAPRAPGPAAPA
jgi:hypothetical protein